MKLNTRGLSRMNDTQLARTAYNAYWQAVGGKSAISGQVLPPFEKTSALVVTGWVAAARAVVEAACAEVRPPEA